jgi:hypothetical protein
MDGSRAPATQREIWWFGNLTLGNANFCFWPTGDDYLILEKVCLSVTRRLNLGRNSASSVCRLAPGVNAQVAFDRDRSGHGLEHRAVCRCIIDSLADVVRVSGAINVDGIHQFLLTRRQIADVHISIHGNFDPIQRQLAHRAAHSNAARHRAASAGAWVRRRVFTT